MLVATFCSLQEVASLVSCTCRAQLLALCCADLSCQYAFEAAHVRRVMVEPSSCSLHFHLASIPIPTVNMENYPWRLMLLPVIWKCEAMTPNIIYRLKIN